MTRRASAGGGASFWEAIPLLPLLLLVLAAAATPGCGGSEAAADDLAAGCAGAVGCGMARGCFCDGRCCLAFWPEPCRWVWDTSAAESAAPLAVEGLPEGAAAEPGRDMAFTSA